MSTQAVGFRTCMGLAAVMVTLPLNPALASDSRHDATKDSYKSSSAPSYQAPTRTEQPRANSWGSQSRSPSSSSFRPLSGGYSQPNNAYRQPSMGYGQSSSGYGQSSNGYRQPGNVYRQPRGGAQYPVINARPVSSYGVNFPNNPGALPTNPGALPRPDGSVAPSWNSSGGNPQISVHSSNNGYGYNNNGYNHNGYNDRDYDRRRHHRDDDDISVIVDPYPYYDPYYWPYGYGRDPYNYYPPQPQVVYVPQQPQVVYVPQDPQVIYVPGQSQPSGAPTNPGPDGQAPVENGGDDQGNIPAAAAQAITDIQEAWIIADQGLLQRHLSSEVPVRVYRDGRYDHTASSADYLQTSKRAFDSFLTQSFILNHRALLSDGRVRAFGRHVYYDADNHRQVGYASYWLQPRDNRWIISMVNTAADPDHLVIDPSDASAANN